MAFCPKCGATLREDDQFCSACGAATSAPADSTSPIASSDARPAANGPPPTTDPDGRKRLTKGTIIRLAIYLVVAGAAITVFVIWGQADVDAGNVADIRSEINALSQKNTSAREAAAEQFAIYSECQNQIGPLLRALENLDAKLDVGLTYADYSTEVGTLSVAYNRIRFEQLDVECITSAGIPAENAFNQYRKAYFEWDECFDDFDCDLDFIEPSLQDFWSKGSSFVSKAQTGLNSLQ